MTYATPQEIQVAVDIGYSYDCNKQRGHRFRKGNRQVWACAADPSRVGECSGPLMAWQTADMINGRYQGHQKFDALADALRRP